MNAQLHLLAPLAMEAAVAETPTAYECPLCYLAARQAVATPGLMWPARQRIAATVQRLCETCKRTTFWCSAGAWEMQSDD